MAYWLYWSRSEAFEFGFWARQAFFEGRPLQGKYIIKKLKERRPLGNFSLKEEFRKGWNEHKGRY